MIQTIAFLAVTFALLQLLIRTNGFVLEREYIWGPGDNGVDELFVQYDRQRVAWWVVQDAGGDVAALCETPGNTQSANR